MKNQEVLTAAIRLICESPGAEESLDYTERAPYILAAFFSQAAGTDRRYRSAHGLEKAAPSPTAYANLEAEFSLSEVFFQPAVYYLAAMLVLEENEALSERLFDQYSDGMALICAELPARGESICDRYGLLGRG